MRVEKSTEARNKQRLTPRRVLKAAWIFIPLILAAAMYFLLPMFPEFTEYAVSRGLFKAFTVPVGFVTSLIPLSLTEICAVLAGSGGNCAGRYIRSQNEKEQLPEAHRPESRKVPWRIPVVRGVHLHDRPRRELLPPEP